MPSSDPRDRSSFGAAASADVELPRPLSSAPISVEHLAVLLSANHHDGESQHLSRDLQLNNIVEQACLATGATGAAIALARGDELICRASTGSTAPALGVVLNIDYGLSAICVQSRYRQRCDDTETDPRVNANACRRLGVRSVLVVPMVYGDFLLGIFEIFSPHPRAFSERDEQTVLALVFRVLVALGISPQRTVPATQLPAREPLAKTVVAGEILTPRKNVQAPIAEKPLTPTITVAEPKERPAPVAAETKKLPDKAAPPRATPAPPYPEFKIVQPPPRDYMTGVLTTLVIALALLLGWVLGHGPTGNTAREEIKAALAKQKPLVEKVQAATTKPAEVSDATPPLPAPTQEVALKPVSRNSAKTQPQDGLVVYQDGKVIYHQPASQKQVPLASLKAPVQLAPDVARTFVTHRVEPDYPERARHLHIQGPVVLQVVVSEDGSVQELRLVSGDSQLASAAIDAVRLWKFKPYLAQGRHLQFETRITVNFALPDSSPVAN